MGHLFARHALLPSGWTKDVRIVLGDHGHIADVVSAGRADVGDDAVDWLLPGIPNLHSHAFQRAMAGRAERRHTADEDFWSWRARMYALAGRLDADAVRCIATQAFVEMLEAGYTSVAEFHYLHNDVSGARSQPLEAIAKAVIDAAKVAGIRLTLLPAFYQFSDFHRAPAAGAQQRFALSLDDYRLLLQRLSDSRGDGVAVGAAIHSLRAADEAAIREIASWRCTPVHIHAAEQQKEVADSVASLGRRPVEWLLDRVPVSGGWCFVHGTHINDAELSGVCERGVTIVLCPSTEANLGDGLFPLRAFVQRGGQFGIGSDSQVCVDPFEELRWLEYGQRLHSQRRHVAATDDEPATGQALVRAVLASAETALGQPVGQIAPGYAADFMVPDSQHASLAGLAPDELLDALVFAPGERRIRRVMVGGVWRVLNGEHIERGKVGADYREAVR